MRSGAVCVYVLRPAIYVCTYAGLGVSGRIARDFPSQARSLPDNLASFLRSGFHFETATLSVPEPDLRLALPALAPRTLDVSSELPRYPRPASARGSPPTTVKVTDGATIVPSSKRALASDGQPSPLAAKGISTHSFSALSSSRGFSLQKGVFSHVQGDGILTRFQVWLVSRSLVSGDAWVECACRLDDDVPVDQEHLDGVESRGALPPSPVAHLT